MVNVIEVDAGDTVVVTISARADVVTVTAGAVVVTVTAGAVVVNAGTVTVVAAVVVSVDTGTVSVRVTDGAVVVTVLVPAHENKENTKGKVIISSKIYFDILFFIHLLQIIKILFRFSMRTVKD